MGVKEVRIVFSALHKIISHCRMSGLKKKQTIVRFNDATPEGGVYSFVLTVPIENAVYLDWVGASEGLVGKFINVAEFENNGQTTANITTIEVDEPSIAEAPEPEAPEPDAIAPDFNEDAKDYVKGFVVKADSEMSNYWIFNHLEFSTPANVEGLPGASWKEITDLVEDPEGNFAYSETKVYKLGDFVFSNEHWFKYTGATGTAEQPSEEAVVWTIVEYLGEGFEFDEETHYPLNADNLANPIVRIQITAIVDEMNVVENRYFLHSFFSDVEGTKIRTPIATGQTGWSPFTPYVKVKPIFIKPFTPYIPPALPRSSQVAGKYWRFITSPINAETLILNDTLSKPKTYKTLTVRPYNLDGSTFTAGAEDYFIINSWNNN